jgi:hypothetical protein
LLILIAFERLVPFLDFKDSVLLLGIESVTAMLLVAWCLWRLALTSLERDKLAQALLKMFHGRRPA